MQKATSKNCSAKLRFVLSNIHDIVRLEKELAEDVLSEEAIKSNKHMLLLKLCKGGWMQAKDIFAVQTIFKEERSFFQALIFIKRFTV